MKKTDCEEEFLEVKPRARISAFVISFNEEKNIRRCLDSLKFCDEIVLIDSHSTDNTTKIAQSLGARVIQNTWPGYVKQKAFGLASTNNEWVLNIDADEAVSPELQKSIIQILEKFLLDEYQVASGYEVNRLVYYFDRWWKNGGWYPEYRTRFLRKSLTVWGGKDPHEKPHVKGAIGRLTGDLYHYTYNSLDEQIQQLCRFASISANTSHQRGQSVYLVSLICAPLIRFFKFFILKKGYKEGTLGFIVGVLEAYYAFIKYARLWEEHYHNTKQTPQ